MDIGDSCINKDPTNVIFRRKNHDKCRDQQQSGNDCQRLNGYTKLEERRVLNATFAFDLVAAELTLENFVDSGIGDNSVNITQSGSDFVFELGDGVWQADGSVAGLDFTLSGGDSILTINDGALSLSSLVLNDNTADTFDITFDQFDFQTGAVSISSNNGFFGSITEFSGASSSINIGTFGFTAGVVDLSNGQHDFDLVFGITNNSIAINDSDEINLQILQSTDGDVSVTAGGTIEVLAGGPGISSGGNLSLAANGFDDDVVLNNNIFADGDIQLSATDQIAIDSSSSITAIGTGNVQLFANMGVGDDFGQIFMEDGSSINATGEIELVTFGTSNGDIHVSNITSESNSEFAISILTSANVFDATATEDANLSAKFGGVSILAGENIGDFDQGDLNVDVAQLLFVSNSEVYITSLESDLVVASSLNTASAFGGGRLIAGGSIIVETDIFFGADAELFSIRSGDVDDDIIIRNSTITLNTSNASTITIDAADDIVFENGSIVTAGSDDHQVSLLADQELFDDGDGGSITNLPGATISVVANHLLIVAGDGIGSSSGLDAVAFEPFRIDANTIVAENLTSNAIAIHDTNDIAIESLINLDRQIELVAAGNITDGDLMNDDVDVSGGEVTLTSLSGSVGAISNDLFKTAFDPIEVSATVSLNVNAVSGLIALGDLSNVAAATLTADSIVLYSDNDLNAFTAMSIAIFNANNLALIADGDNDGIGTLTIGDNISIGQDLRIEGHEIIALDALSNQSVANLSADRLLISVDESIQINTMVSQLDVELDHAVDINAQQDGQHLQINNTGSITLVDLNCDNHSILGSNDDVRINNIGTTEIIVAVQIGGGSFFVQSSEDFTQQAAGTISANSLGLVSGGDTILDSDNDVNHFASLHNGITLFNDVDDLAIGIVDFAFGSMQQDTLVGISGNSGQTKLITAANLAVTQAVNALDGTLFLEVTNEITQTSEGSILVANFAAMADAIELTANNNIDSLALETNTSAIVSSSGNSTVTSITFAGATPFQMAIDGIAAGSQLKLITGGDLSLVAPVSASTVFLDVGGDLSQSASGLILADELGLMVDGQTLLDAANNVETLAGQTMDLLVFNDVDHVSIGAVIAFAGSPFEMSAIGITSFGDTKINSGSLFIGEMVNVGNSNFGVTTNGDLNQDAEGIIVANGLLMMVNGTTELTQTNQLQNLAADNTGLTLVNSIGDLNIGPVTVAATSIYEMSFEGVSSDGDLKISVAGNLNIDSTINLTLATAFLVVEGNIEQAATGAIHATGLGLMVDGTTFLNAANDVDIVASENIQATVFNDTDDLAIGSVTVAAGSIFSMTVAGISTDDADIKITSGNLSIQERVSAGVGNILIVADGNVSQFATGTISGNGLALMVNGSTILDANNCVNQFAADNSGFTFLNNEKSLSIATVESFAGTPQAMLVSGVQTANAGLKIAANGDVNIQNAISTGSGIVFVSTNGNLTQSESGTIAASQLGLMVEGAAILDADNSITRFASQTDGLLILNSSENVVISSVAIATPTPFGMMVAGVNTNNHDAKISSGNLLIEETVDVANATLFLNADGNLNQTDTGTILADNLGLMVAGVTNLSATNNVNSLASTSSGSLRFTNGNDLIVSNVTVAAGTEFEMMVSGIITEDSDLKLIVNGSFLIDQAIDTGTRTTFITATQDLAQSASGTITASAFGLMVNGNTLLNANNDVDLFAASNGGSIVFQNVDNVDIGEVTIFGGTPNQMTATGITSADNDVKISAGGSILVSRSIDTETANLFITTTQNLEQSASGIITAGGFGMMVDGTTELLANNDVDYLAANNSGDIVFADIDDLQVGSVTVLDETLFEMIVDGIQTDDHDLKLSVGGDLNLDSTTDVGSATAFLDVGSNLSQASSGTIAAGALGTMVAGMTSLSANNNVSIFAADNVGTTLFENHADLTVGVASVGSGTAYEMQAIGITTLNSNAKVDVHGDLFIAQQIYTGTATTFLASTGDLAQSGNGTISAQTFGLMIDGNTILDANNDVDVFAAQTGGRILFNDIDDLSIGVADSMGMFIAGITTDNSDLKLITGDDLQLGLGVGVGDSNAILTVGGDLFQGVVHANGLGLMVQGETFLNGSFAGFNFVNVFAAVNQGLTIFNAAHDIVIGEVTAFVGTQFEMSVSGIQSESDVKLSAGGNVAIESQITMADSTLFISAPGTVTQTEAGTINTDKLGLMVGSAFLRSANDVNEIAANNSDETIIYDVDDVVVSTVSIASGSIYEMEAVGISTIDANAKVIAGDDIMIDDRIDLGSGNLLLVTTGDLTQSTGDPDGIDGKIISSSLGLMVGGITDLSNPDNEIQNFSADNVGNTSLANGIDISISSVEVDSMMVEGVKLESDFDLQIAGSVDQTSAIVVAGSTIIHADGNICLTGGDCDSDGVNDNDFIGSISIVAGDIIEIADTNQLMVDQASAAIQIYLRSGDGDSGALHLAGDLTTTSADGQILLQSDSGITQSPSNSVITTQNLLLGSSNILDARNGNVELLGDNQIANIAANIEGSLDFTNRQSLMISPLNYTSICNDLEQSFAGILVDSVTFNVTANPLNPDTGDLTDASDAVLIINNSANFNVAGNIVLGDSDAILAFTGQHIDDLLSDNVAVNFVQISAAGNAANADGSDILATQNVSLFVDSTIILGDSNVNELLFIDTVESPEGEYSAGDILQTQNAESEVSLIDSSQAAFVSAASVQLTNTSFDQLAIDANVNHSLLIHPFIINASIGSTFTGSIDANIFADLAASQFMLNGNIPIPGVFDVEDAFTTDGFFAGNNEFVNALRVGSIIVNQDAVELVAFDDLGLSALQIEDVSNTAAAITSVGDAYVESLGNSNIDISANLDVTNVFSNITIVAGQDVTLHNGAELRRLDQLDLVGLVNTIQGMFSSDHFILDDPRSVIEAPGDVAFSDLNAQLDSAVGYQLFDFFFGNSGEFSFNVIAGWFVSGVSPSQAIDAGFQPTLLQEMTDITGEFLLSDFANFGQGISAFSLRMPSLIEGMDTALSLTNTSQFDQSYFADKSFLLSQIFVTNDARINLFADGGSTDLNFTQEILPTRTVVENPEPIVVATPTFNVPETPGSAPHEAPTFVNFIQDPESQPIQTERPAQSYFRVKYTADDDGFFEEVFKWEDPNDDPDAIRAALENAVLDENGWPDTDNSEGNWTERIKEENEVKPGLYFIFEVQEEQELPEPVDAPVNRTDIENLIEPDLGESAPPATDSADSAPALPTFFDRNSERLELSEATKQAYVGSALLFAQCLIKRKNNSSQPTRDWNAGTNMFSRASRLIRNNRKPK